MVDVKPLAGRFFTEAVLAAIGLYNVIAYNVTQRMHEMGVRVALGANRRDVISLIVRKGLGVVLPGIAIGALISMGEGCWIAPLLFRGVTEGSAGDDRGGHNARRRRGPCELAPSGSCVARRSKRGAARRLESSVRHRRKALTLPGTPVILRNACFPPEWSSSMLVVALATLLFQAAPAAAQSSPDAGAGARNPAYARDGRLAVSVQGDLWIVSPTGEWKQATTGPAWDREPSWTSDGTAIVFSSDRSGKFNLWRVAVGSAGTSEPERLTTSELPDGQPAVAPDGRIFFIRGRLGAATLWMRAANGTETRVTKDHAVEQWPALSADGTRLAFVSIADGTHKLHVRTLESSRDTSILTDARIEYPAWSPVGDRISWTATGARGSVYVSPADGRYVNLLSARHAESAWSPDGKTVALTDIPPTEPILPVGYNGDPDRTGDREANLLDPQGGRLWTVDAPVAPDRQLAERAGGPSTADRTAHNADAFDELWNRTATLYYSTPDATARRAAWEELKTKYRPRAVAAKTDDDLKTVLHDMLREHPPYRQSATGRAAVSSAHPVATAAGVEMLARGGNVVDAAVAVSFALGVVEPDASGPGGYGQMLVFQKGMEKPVNIEFMTRVPEDAGLGNTASLVNGRLPDGGPVVVNVPGTVAAMRLAWEKFGSKKIPWADLLAPAIRAARDGYIVSEGLATTLATEREQFLKSDGARAIFFHDDQPAHAGDTIKNPDLAQTLELIAAGGADAFYRGDIAKRMVNDLHSHGNAMKVSDMARYFAVEREAVPGSYSGYTFFSSAPPVSGGAELAAKMSLLEQYPSPKPYTDDAGTLHAMIAAWQLVPSTRNRIADPSLWPTNIEPFLNRDTARVRWRCFDPSKAINPTMLRGDTLTCALPDKRTAKVELTEPPECYAHGYDATLAAACRAAGTTAFTVADADGNVVAVTQTLGTWGGNFYVSPGLGFLYNDKLASYGNDPNAYGARLPFARHGSTIAPTIVFEGSGSSRHAVMALAAAGNAWITSAVYQILEGMIDQHLDPQAALELPRFLIGGGGGRGGAGAATPRGATIQMEDGFSPEVMHRLETLGYRTQIVSLPGELREGYGAALKIEKGKVTAGADPRRAGAAGAVP
ncbi:MAG: gamma-glutamyltransferase [Gemmatimonadaceae bacterium]